MAAASFSSDVLQRFEEANQSPPPELSDDVANPTPELSDDVERLEEAIKNLPPELREKIYKEYVAEMKKERVVMGWKKLHKELLKKPISDSLQQIVAERKCFRCGIGCFVGVDPFCWLCEVTEIEIFFQLQWEKVHEELLKKPISDSMQQIVAERKCFRCGIGCFVGDDQFCWLCEPEMSSSTQKIHRMLYEAENMSDVELLLEDAERRSRSSQRTLSLEELD